VLPLRRRIFLSSALSRRSASALLIVGVAVQLLSGCAARRMKSDFSGFERAFAETSNREVLLNLARLQNRDPTYFFKLGQITSSYRMQASLNGSGNYVIQGTGSGGNAMGGGSPGLLYENDPVFTFIPVNDETNAQLLLKPIPPETFYILYQQGWRVDQLMRLMIERIEIAWPKNGHCSIETIRNLPPSPNSKAVQPDPDSLSDYATFLRISAIAYALQKHGYLLLQGGQSKFIPYDTQSALDATSQMVSTSTGGTERGQGGEGPRGSSAPNASDIAKAATTNTSWEKTKDNKWIFGQLVPSVKFVLNPPSNFNPANPPKDQAALQEAVQKAIHDELINRDDFNNGDADFGELREGTALRETLTALGKGFSIEAVQSGQLSPTAQGQPASAGELQCDQPPHLLMRSLLGLMSAAAQEQTAFDTLIKRDPDIPQSRWLSENGYKPQPFTHVVPKIEQIPILRIAWTPEDKGTAPLVQVDYGGKQYFIADSGNSRVSENEHWNKDMFRLISQLQSQVTVDISKFPLPAVLQLNTQ
jgi:hypothetical protein